MIGLRAAVVASGVARFDETYGPSLACCII